MAYTGDYATREPRRTDVDAHAGPLVLEFGAPWCAHCQLAQDEIAQAFDAHPGIAHLKIEDGRSRPLGRSFRVKLWPTLVFLRGGEERARLVRPQHAHEIELALATIADDASA